MTKERHRPRFPVCGARCWATVLAFAWQGFALGLVHAAPPEAAARSRVLIVVDEPDDPLLGRVLPEVTAIPGVDVVMRPPVGSIDADARGEHADAAIRSLPSGKGVEVWMADAATGRSLIRELVIDETPEGPDVSLIALQTAELLRTSLPLLREPAVPTPAPPPAPPTATIVVEPPALGRAASAVQASVGLLYSPGGVSPALQAWLSYQRLFSRHLGIAFELSAPLARGSINSVEGGADVGALIAGGGLLARLTGDQGNVTIAASLGGGLASVLFRGRPIPSLTGESTTAYTGLIYLRVNASWHPVWWLGLGASAMVGTTTSRIEIKFLDRDVGEWGMPVVAAFLHAELDWERRSTDPESPAELRTSFLKPVVPLTSARRP